MTQQIFMPKEYLEKLEIRGKRKFKIGKMLENVLHQLFNPEEFKFLEIRREFGAGLTDSRVFEVQAVRRGFVQPQLPQVVKIDLRKLIQQEKQAYEKFVETYLENVVKVINDTCHIDYPLSALCYELAGSIQQNAQIYSLKGYYKYSNLRNERDRFRKALDRLLGTADFWWRYGYPDATYRMATDYDLLLPVNLLVNPLQKPPSEKKRINIIAREDILEGVKHGDIICLKGFQVIESDQKKRELTLSWPRDVKDGNKLIEHHRVRFCNVRRIEDYKEGEIIEVLYGYVSHTRTDILARHASKILKIDTKILLKQQNLIEPSINLTLPNPLLKYQNILNVNRKVDVSVVHGDLNLENILVTDDEQIRLIDFSDTRMGHVLHDLLRLETGVITYLLTDVLIKHKDLSPIETIYTLYQTLHQVLRWLDDITPDNLDPRLEGIFETLLMIRFTAVAYFQDQRISFEELQRYGRTLSWQGFVDEYYPGLVIYLLGTLKFKNLDDYGSIPKTLTLWGAATLLDLMDNPSKNPAKTGQIEHKKTSHEPSISKQTETKSDPFWQTLIKQISSDFFSHEEGYGKGKKDGELKRSKEIAQELFGLLELDKISGVTGLNIKTLQELQEKK